MIQLSKVSYRSLLVAVLSAAVAVPVLAGTALAQTAPVTESGVERAVEPAGEVSAAGARPHGAPVSVVGEVSRYVVGPLGHVRAFILKDGTAVMLHGTSGDAMAKDVAVGQSVRVEGVSPAAGTGSKLIMRAAVFGQHGQVVTPPARGERGGDRDARKEQWSEMREEIAKLPNASANGTVQTVLAGHHGKLMAVVLTDGTSVFLRPRLAKQVMARGIRPGDRIETTGKGATYPLGASVVVSSIKFSDGAQFQVAPGTPAVAPRT